MSKMKIWKLSFLLLVLIFCGSFSIVNAQTNVQCGSIIDGEFAQERDEHIYAINLAPGDRLNVSGETVGDYLKFAMSIDAPTTGRIADTGSLNLVYRNHGYARDTPTIQTGELSERGVYSITLYPIGPGLYTLFVGCTLRDGTVIKPGDAITETTSSSTSSSAPAVQTFSGVGFPGLPPVDFSAVAKIPMIAGTPMTGVITPTGGEILGYTLDASGGEVVDLSISKLSGNLNLGVVVLSADNEVVFQASLVTSQSLTTRLTLPSPGQYTIGVFRIDLLPPASPEATAFQVQATINPG